MTEPINGKQLVVDLADPSTVLPMLMARLNLLSQQVKHGTDRMQQARESLDRGERPEVNAMEEVWGVVREIAEAQAALLAGIASLLVAQSRRVAAPPLVSADPRFLRGGRG